MYALHDWLDRPEHADKKRPVPVMDARNFDVQSALLLNDAPLI